MELDIILLFSHLTRKQIIHNYNLKGDTQAPHNTSSWNNKGVRRELMGFEKNQQLGLMNQSCAHSELEGILKWGYLNNLLTWRLHNIK